MEKFGMKLGKMTAKGTRCFCNLSKNVLIFTEERLKRTRKYKADLLQAMAEAEAEVANLISTLGERISFSRVKGTLKEQISAIKPVLEDLRLKKQERIKDFSEIQLQIVRICGEIAGNVQSINSADPQILRLQKVNSHLNTIHELSVVMSIDFIKTISEVHPSLSDPSNSQLRSISNDTLARLTGVIHSLKQEKQQRLQKLKDLGGTLVELWNLMDTSVDEQKRFNHVTCLISSSIDEISSQGCLALDVIEQTEVEVERLNVLKASKMKELVLRRQNELEEIYRGVHMDVDSDTAQQILISLIDSGNVDLSDLLSSMDDQIAKAKEQSLSRKDILDKVEKWKYASEEEKWLDDYERDENRYSAGRGAHKNLKRAEKARILVSKIQSIVESLTAKVKAWEMEKGIPFLFDKVPLLHTLEEYTLQRQEREDEKRRSREQRRLLEQLATEQEALFGSRPTIKKPLGQSTNANMMVGTPIGRRAMTPLGRHGISGSKERRESGKGGTVIPVNYVALPKDDSISHGS
ncbi:hypothetical protein L1049_011395 [Liquidambar formosana]|uniref:Uncharacterized protein n=1 Tax=Liquidambar formosana TaxID=63359 RepID=A0AAP0X271_LIQFO